VDEADKRNIELLEPRPNSITSADRRTLNRRATIFDAIGIV